MLVKIVRKGGESIHTADHLTTTRDADGVLVELLPKGPAIRLPDDARAVYVMNHKGDTVDSIRWPPKRKGKNR